MHHADDGDTVLDQADRDADRVEPVHEVRGAVERVDEPAGVEVVSSGLFAVHGQGRIARQELTDRALAREVGVADPVAGRFLADCFEVAAERAAHDLASGARGTVGAREQVAVVERAHATPAVSASTSSGVPAAMSWRRALQSSVTSARPRASRTTAPASTHAR